MSNRDRFVADLGRQLVDAAPRVKARHRRVNRVVAGVVGLVVVAVVAASLAPLSESDESTELVVVGGDQAEDTADAVEGVGGAEWEEAQTTLGGDSLPGVVWTGTSVVVLHTMNGGNDVAGEVWDPATREATAIADSGLNWRFGPAVVWTGEEILVVGGTSRPGLNQIGAAYDPTSDAWRPIADPPGGVDGEYHALVGPAAWTGSEMLIWNAGLAYDPVTDSWREIASSPLSERARPSTVWTGSELVVWGGCHEADAMCDEANTGLLADGASYDPATDTWSMLPASPLPPAVHVVAGWTSAEVVYTVTEDGDGSAGATALYDPETRTWRDAEKAPLSPRRSAGAVWAEDRFVVWGGKDEMTDSRQSTGVVFDPAAGHWSLLPDPPGPGRILHTMTDTGDGIYISATRTQSPPLILHLRGGSSAPILAEQPVSPTPKCVRLPTAQNRWGLQGRPVGELWPQGFRPGFNMSEYEYAEVNDPVLETPWYAIGTIVRDLGGRPLGLGVWLMPDPIVTYIGGADPDSAVVDAASWHLSAYNALARTASIWQPNERHLIYADPEAEVAGCFDQLPEPVPFISGQLLDGAGWVLTDDPDHGLCLAASGLDHGCDDLGLVIGADDPPETMRVVVGGNPDLELGEADTGDLAYGYLPDGAVTVEVVDPDGDALRLGVVLDTNAGIWAAPMSPGDNPVAVRYLDGDQQVVKTVTR